MTHANREDDPEWVSGTVPPMVSPSSGDEATNIATAFVGPPRVIIPVGLPATVGRSSP